MNCIQAIIKAHSSVSAAKKTKRRVAQKCVIYWYRKVAKFSLLYLQNYYADFYQIYIFFALHIHYFTYQSWRKSLQHFLRYLFLKIAQVSLHFSSPSCKITNIFKSHKIIFHVSISFKFKTLIKLIEAYISLKFWKNFKKIEGARYYNITNLVYNLLSHLLDASSMLLIWKFFLTLQCY